MSKKAKSRPAALRMWPMPGVANSTMKLPIFGPGARASSFNPMGAFLP